MSAIPRGTTSSTSSWNRAATVAELASAIGRPKSTVAYHVGVLVEAGMLRVVRTRKVRAVEERFTGALPAFSTSGR